MKAKVISDRDKAAIRREFLDASASYWTWHFSDVPDAARQRLAATARLSKARRPKEQYLDENEQIEIDRLAGAVMRQLRLMHARRMRQK